MKLRDWKRGMSDNLKLNIMIIVFLIFLSFCFGFFVAGMMAESKRNSEKEEE